MTARPDLLLNPHVSTCEQSGMLTMRQNTQPLIKTPQDEFFESLYSQINQNNQNIGRRIEESRQFDEKVKTLQELQASKGQMLPEAKGYTKILDNTLCGLSNIHKDSMDQQESFDDDQQNSNFGKGGPGETQSNISDLPLSVNNKSQECNLKMKDRVVNKNNISIEMA